MFMCKITQLSSIVKLVFKWAHLHTSFCYLMEKIWDISYHYFVQLYSLHKWAIFNSISPLITPCNQFHSALISFCLRNLYVSQYPQCIILNRNNFKIIFYQLGSDTFIPPSLVTKTFKIPFKVSGNYSSPFIWHSGVDSPNEAGGFAGDLGSLN